MIEWYLINAIAMIDKKNLIWDGIYCVIKFHFIGV